MQDRELPKAQYDDNGNVIIPSSTESRSFRNAGWEVTDDDEVVVETRDKIQGTKCNYEEVITVLKSARGNLIGTTNSIVIEGKRQYRESLKDFWDLLKQPVWVPRKNKAPKKYSRGMLFVTDVVRFGGTFAVIFAGLFISMNAQSFAQIVTPYLDPVERLTQTDTSDLNVMLPPVAADSREEGNLLAYLGNVGPPENWIMIPKLNIKAPLMEPSFDSLLREDWIGVEEDIQEALEDGVVHYPGTARPGQAGNFFVTGHSSYYPWAAGEYKYIFARLHELEIGDEYWVYYGGDKHRYIVTGKKEVKPSDVTVLDQPVNKRMGTLMTCTPVGTTLRRLILTAQEVDPTTGIAMEVGAREKRISPTPLPSALPI